MKYSAAVLQKMIISRTTCTCFVSASSHILLRSYDNNYTTSGLFGALYGFGQFDVFCS